MIRKNTDSIECCLQKDRSVLRIDLYSALCHIQNRGRRVDVGQYDIVIDVGGDGNLTAGFLIPEVPSALISTLFMFLTLTAATVTKMQIQREAAPRTA